MNLGKLFNIFNWSKADFSEFYLATLMSYFLFQLFKLPIQQVTNWLRATMDVLFNLSLKDSGQQWTFLVIFCFLLVSIIRIFLIEPFGAKFNVKSRNSWDTFFTGFFVFGFFIYTVNLGFKQPMDSRWSDLIIKLTNGWENLYDTRGLRGSESAFLTIVPWIWIAGPLASFYYSRFTPASTPLVKKID